MKMLCVAGLAIATVALAGCGGGLTAKQQQYVDDWETLGSSQKREYCDFYDRNGLEAFYDHYGVWGNYSLNRWAWSLDNLC